MGRAFPRGRAELLQTEEVAAREWRALAPQRLQSCAPNRLAIPSPADMTKTARVYKIEMLIRNRGHVSFSALMEALEVSRATLKRDLEYLRDQLGAPIEYDRDLNGYRFVEPTRGARHELPGLWFNERELYSLLMAHQLLEGLDADGVISRHLQPLLERIHQMLDTSQADAQALLKRVKIVSAARRPVPSQFFELVAEALLKRRRLHLRYHSRGRGEVGERDVSPQRLVHYRATWYLDAWCHGRERLLRFALDAIEDASLLETRAREVPLRQVEREMDAGYGIYAGADAAWVTLAFSAQAATWVSREEWHPQQRGRFLPDGRYQLELPYTDPTELAMDVLRHVDEVTIVSDTGGLQAMLKRRLERGWALHVAGPAAG